MTGALIGDIVGSRYEFNNIKTKSFGFFGPGCRFTDDSVMTLAVAESIMDAGEGEGKYERMEKLAFSYMHELGNRYPDAGYGGRFRRWLFTDPAPYSSYGNGSAMRISPAGFYAKDEDELKKTVRAVTELTHGHPEGIKGAEATAMCIFLARRGADKAEIRGRIEKDYYPLGFTLDEIRPTYGFYEICQKSVPQALEAFFEGEDFEDTVRNCISIGGDCDTTAAIAGGIAEAYFGIPESIKEEGLAYLDAYQKEIITRWNGFLKERNQ